MNRTGVTLLGMLAGCLALAGCKIGPNYHRPDIPAPAQWRGQTATPESIANTAWWDLFQDPVLTGLISEALTNNYDARIAVARIEQAQGNYRIQNSDLFPALDASAGWSRGRAPNPFTGAPVTGNQFSVLGLLSYEVDIWGRLRRLSEAARANLLAAEDARQTVYMTLIGQVAGTYFDLRSLDEQVQISERTVRSREESLELTRVLFSNGQGVASELDIRQAETQLYSAQATLANAQRLEALRENELNLLLGRNPGPVPRGRWLKDLPLADHIPAGIPSDVLLRRPDIHGAEEQLIAANANIGAARAAYFPTISLTAALGLQSVQLSDLFDAGASHTWRFAPQLAMPLFNAGRIAGGVTVAKGAHLEALVNYERAIQNAFREVEDALISVQKLGEQFVAREKNVEAERSRLDLSFQRYRAGVSSYSDVLDAQRSLFVAELDLAQLRSDRLTAVAQLYRALGGGWQTAPQ